MTVTMPGDTRIPFISLGIAGRDQHVMPPHIIGNYLQNRFTSVRDHFIADPGLNPSNVDPGVGRRKEMIEVLGVDCPKISALTSFNIPHADALSLCQVDGSAMAARYFQIVLDACLRRHDGISDFLRVGQS